MQLKANAKCASLESREIGTSVPAHFAPQVVVAQGLADAQRGKAVSVPSARYKALTGAARYTPRPVLRAFMRRQTL